MGKASVTKADLTASTTELRGEMNELRGEMKAMTAELRGEISSAVNKMLLAQLAIRNQMRRLFGCTVQLTYKAENGEATVHAVKRNRPASRLCRESDDIEVIQGQWASPQSIRRPKESRTPPQQRSH